MVNEGLHILYEDNHLIAVNKRCGEIVQADLTGDTPLEQKVKDYIKRKYNKPGEVFLGVVHRVDRPVSGVVLFARTSKSLIRLNQMFQDKTIRKTYWAVVKERPPKDSDTLVHYIVRNTRVNRSYAHISERSNSQKAILHYRCIASSDNYYLLEIDLETGRHHQIRCQLAAIGCPIRGDLKYGYPRSNPNGGIHLHALQMQFKHPVKEEKMLLKASPPEDELWQAFVASF